MAVNVIQPQQKQKKSALDTAAQVTSIGANLVGLADKAGSFGQKSEPKLDVGEGKTLPAKNYNEKYDSPMNTFNRRKSTMMG